jgi:hypothetical protein
MDEAKELLRNAVELDKDVRMLALDDEDLKPLWDWIVVLQQHAFARIEIERESCCHSRR